MAVKASGRFVPPSAFAAGTGKAFTGAYAWNAPREAVGRERPLNQGGAAGYIAKYISKNIDGYALDGQLDNDTGRPLKDTAAAVTAWASTWRIPQFKTVGLPTMGAYRELRKLPRGVSIADEFDERVEAARAAADSGDFALYISAQGGANVPRDCQTVRVARSPSDEVNEYEEEVERVVGIYAPHLGARHIHITRTTDWRIVPKVPVVEPLTLKSGIAAPRSERYQAAAMGA